MLLDEREVVLLVAEESLQEGRDLLVGDVPLGSLAVPAVVEVLGRQQRVQRARGASATAQ